MVARIGDSLRLETKPLNGVYYRLLIHALFFFGIRVVKAKIAFPTMIFRKSKIDSYGLTVSDVEVPIGLWRNCQSRIGEPWIEVTTNCLTYTESRPFRRVFHCKHLPGSRL